MKPNNLQGLHLLIMAVIVVVAAQHFLPTIVATLHDNKSNNYITNNNKNNSNSNSNSNNSKNLTTLILLQDEVNLTDIEIQFREFLEMFGISVGINSVNFLNGNGLSTLVKQLESSKYSTILFVLNNKNTKDSGYCDMSEQLSVTFNKEVLFWPCPKMKRTEKFLPSYETISFAVKSISQEFNWTEAVIFATETNWGLPLAIAANLHVPYRIEIGTDDLGHRSIEDKIGKAIIITSPLNSPETQHVLREFQHFKTAKIFLIDVVGSIFNSKNQLYGYLNTNQKQSSIFLVWPGTTIHNTSGNYHQQFNKTPHHQPYLYQNLLVLTILTEKFKQFMNRTLHVEFELYHNWTRINSQEEHLKDSLYWPSRTKRNHNTTPFMIDPTTAAVPTMATMLKNENRNSTKSENIKLPPSEYGNFTVNALKEQILLLTEIVNETVQKMLNYLVTNQCDFQLTDSRNTSIPPTLSSLPSSLSSSSSSSSSMVLYIEQCYHLIGCHPTMSNNQNKPIIIDLSDFCDFFCNFLFESQSNEERTSTVPPIIQQRGLKNVNIVKNFTIICEYLIKTKRPSDVMPEIKINLINSIVNLYRSERSQHKRRRRRRSIKRNNDTLPGLPSTDAHNNHPNHSHDDNSDKVKNNHLTYSEYFSLFDFIVSIVNGANDTTFKFDFIVLDFQNIINMKNESIFAWRPFLILQQNHINDQMFTTHFLPGYLDRSTQASETFFSCGIFCWTVITLAIVILFCIMAASLAAGIAVRNYLLKKRLSKGPNKIVLSPSDFVFPVDSRRVDEGIEAMLCCWLQQLQEFGGPEVDKPDLLKGSIGSLKNLGLTTAPKNNSGTGSLARHNTVLDMRARYNGDLVQLKEIPITTALTELKSKAMDHMVTAHGLRHENINPLIGWLSDANRTAMVFEYCSRGSLQDVLIMDDIKLDWSFRLSLLTDLVRGMRYLHSSPLRVHGGLSSRNCVVDARWVLKITDYGLPSFYDAQGIPPPTKTAKELLWTAPEALRNTKGFPKCGTQPGDVYSFGIIMQEVVVRGEPYCMLSLSPDEIIAKIKRPPPLIRPSVSKGAAPPEAINIMRQCWAEMPDMRPDFNTVYERFKQLNHGRKVNFVDTMFQMLEKYSNNLEELIRERTEQLDIERKKTEQLLNRMLPSSVAEKLKMGLAVDPEEFGEVTIYFSDIVGFTTIAAHCSPVQVVDLLNDLYTCFDATINAYNVYKVETIGDAYMVVSGLPGRIPDHAEQIATMALDLLHQSGRFKVKHLPGVPLQLRIGLHTGPCCAGVVGLTMPRYCLFGDTVNTASRMESTGSSWRIHLSEATRDRLEMAGGYNLEPRGPIEIKGKGMMNTYWLLGKKGFEKPLPTPPPIGLDESLIRDSMNSSTQMSTMVTPTSVIKVNNNNNSTSPLPPACQSPSVTGGAGGETIDVKVEITPPSNNNSDSNPILSIPTSISLESTQAANFALNNLSINISDFPPKSTSTSPQQRKMSEFSQDGLLNPANFNRLNPSPNSVGASSSRLFKKIEEMMDLSSPYNHYRCLSPSESNLLQCGDLKIQFHKFHDINKPGSSRLLRRQFSLDKDDGGGGGGGQISNTSGGGSISQKQSLDMPMIQSDNRCTSIIVTSSQLPKTQMPSRLHKQNSNSMGQDLEKIEEIPMSPASITSTSNNHNHNNLGRNIKKFNEISLVMENQHQQQQQTSFIDVIGNDDDGGSGGGDDGISDDERIIISSGNIPSPTSTIAAAASGSNGKREINLNVETLILR